ncbi:beta tubulin [Alsobacter soli]|uniref:Beta tubulin n=1 Tax=Alsobacter soli TaxID=2109933 RepID=A0A2T1HSA1_9HYPH|nr:DUF2163 domain-containing protein [Alsobacter soli]PSC04517.1 beta tubulin [Alsobacter soli]
MRTVPDALSAAIAAGATTLARCWKVLRRDGAALGFTDHDRDLAFGGVTFAAGAALEASDCESQLGFAIGGGEVAGALSSGAISEADLAGGLYDGATVEAWMVDWTDPASRILLDVYVIGEIRRADRAFVAELRGLAQRFDDPRGRTYQPACAADLGDERCHVDLADPRWRAEAVVTATDGAVFIRAAGLAAFEGGFFAGGRLRFTGGASAGFACEVKAHDAGVGEGLVTLWQAPGAPVAPGDAFVVTAGCDKRLATCAGRFGNVANFRGFPHMPGNDFLLRAARNGDPAMDGGSLFR